MSWGLSNNRVALAPLRQWMEGETWVEISAQQDPGGCEDIIKQTILCKTAIAYGIAQLLRQAARCHHNSALPRESLDGKCSIDNFAVRHLAPSRRSRTTWKDIDGVDMLSPRLSVNIIEPSFLQEEDNGDQDKEMGGYLEAEFPSIPETDGEAVFVNQSEEDFRCHSFGVLLYEFFLSCPSIYAEDDSNSRGWSESTTSRNVDSSLEHARKKVQLVDLRECVKETSRTARARREKSFPALPRGGCANLSGGGLPSSLSLVIHNLLDCGEDDHPENAYESLDAVINDLHLLLLDPSRFLFDRVPTYDDNERMKLPFREHQIYGRENEVALITEAFCRVSSGKIESLFIGGFSGSGKSRLVNGLTARIDAVGGYVLTHKFDQMSRDKSILDVVAMFNDLCLLIKKKTSQRDLLILVDDLVQVFGLDWLPFARLLPNIKAIATHLERSADDDGEELNNQLNVRRICFMLQRFIRVVSSAAHPVVLFLDDLQWCDKSVLTLIESILCDVTGTTCVFFVGTYRSNEVPDDHEIFGLSKRLKSFGVPTTMLSLEGLNPSSLNTMVSDALCIFPRITEPLSDIIYQKTKGNPFFVLEFMRSLVDRGLLDYNTNTYRWVWDDDDVSSMDITGNVLHLLWSKMSGLSTSIQSALKVAACFGIEVKESVLETLSAHPKHSDIRDKLDQVIRMGYMVKVGTSEFKFVHDKVREVAYSLIPEQDRDLYHLSLGMSLYSTTKGTVADDMLFSIADQIKHGIANLAAGDDPDLRIDIAKLYELAGVRAVACADHAASRSYLNYALFLLPTDHWKSHYDLSIQISLRLAKSCYSCGDVEKAQYVVQEIIGQCHSFEEKIPAHALLAKILLDRKGFTEAYVLCREVLAQLGEDIPDLLHPFQVTQMIKKTWSIAKMTAERDLLEMNEMSERLSYSIYFYDIISIVASEAKPQIFPFVACRMVQLTMQNGICKHSLAGFLLFAMVLCSNSLKENDIEGALRMGKAAISTLKKRYNTSQTLSNLHLGYYGYIGFHTEPLQTCADMLRQGFVTCMSIGEVGDAFLNSSLHIRTALIAGDRLPTLLEKVDYYFTIANTYQNDSAKAYLSIQRNTLSILIGKGDSFNSTCNGIEGRSDNASATVLESMYFQVAIQEFWLGHNERCQYFIEKFLKQLLHRLASDMCRYQYITFIGGLNSLQLLKKRSSERHRSMLKKSIQMFKRAASRSSWNFNNKIHLLEAEQFSLQGDDREAQASYAAAINSARSSGFIHEQGLACELFGYHCKKVNNLTSALDFFDQAKQCYKEWGSQMKVDNIAIELILLSDHSKLSCVGGGSDGKTGDKTVLGDHNRNPRAIPGELGGGDKARPQREEGSQD